MGIFPWPKKLLGRVTKKRVQYERRKRKAGSEQGLAPHISLTGNGNCWAFTEVAKGRNSCPQTGGGVQVAKGSKYGRRCLAAISDSHVRLPVQSREEYGTLLILPIMSYSPRNAQCFSSDISISNALLCAFRIYFFLLNCSIVFLPLPVQEPETSLPAVPCHAKGCWEHEPPLPQADFYISFSVAEPACSFLLERHCLRGWLL